MNSIELLSSFAAFSPMAKTELCDLLTNYLTKEMCSETDLGVLASIPYITGSYMGKQRISYPEVPDYTRTREIVQILMKVGELLAPRITELTDDQFALLCGGLANCELPVSEVLAISSFVDCVEEEYLVRRMNRGSVENVIDVLRFMDKMNRGEAVVGQISEIILGHKSSLNVSGAVDIGVLLSNMIKLPTNLQSELNNVISNSIGEYNDIGNLATYLFNTSCQDKQLLRKFIDKVETLKCVQVRDYQSVRKLKIYIEKKYSDILTDEFTEKLEAKKYFYTARKLLENNEELQNEMITQGFTYIQSYLRFRCINSYLYSDYDYVHIAWMPEKLALQFALPHYHLLGKYVPDTRLWKEPPKTYLVRNDFHIKNKWLGLLGWRVLSVNYHDLLENYPSKESRDEDIRHQLHFHSISPY